LGRGEEKNEKYNLGTYFLEGMERKTVAVFKPNDEEAFAYLNIIIKKQFNIGHIILEVM